MLSHCIRAIRATEQVAIFEAHCIRVNSCNSWAKNREQNNLWLKLFRGFFFCKVILPRTPFPTEMTKNNSCFFLLKSCSFKQESRFFLLDFHRPAPAVRTPRAQDAVAPRAWRDRPAPTNRWIFFTKLYSRATHYQQKHPKTTAVFSSLKVVLLSKKVVFIPFIVIAPQLWCTFPTTVVKPPHNCGVPSPQLWGSKNDLWKNEIKGQRDE